MLQFFMKGNKNLLSATHLLREETGFELKNSEHKIFILGTYLSLVFTFFSAL